MDLDDTGGSDVFRYDHRDLSPNEKGWVHLLKDQADTLLQSMIDVEHEYPDAAREFSIARTRLEETVMWAVKGITK